ncbi:MAG: IS1595 family transposase, partial [Methylobacter sp.]
MKNKVQFQKGYSLSEFMKNYGTEDQCRKALFQWRWPQ